jgi:signal peptidase I
MMRRREALGLTGTALLALSAGPAAAATFGEWLDGADIAARFVAAGIPVKSYAMGSSSMMPTLGDKDVLLADLRMGGTVPGRGEIIVFRPPGPDTVYVKRAIGLPGDRIALKAGRLVLNGKVVERRPKGMVEMDLPLGPTPVSIYEEALSGVRPYQISEMSDSGMLDEIPETMVPSDAVFVLGDNRDNSMDSRVAAMGPIPVGNIVGRVVYRLRPNSGWLEPPETVPGLG